MDDVGLWCIAVGFQELGYICIDSGRKKKIVSNIKFRNMTLGAYSFAAVTEISYVHH